MKSNYHVFSHGRLERKDNTLVLETTEGTSQHIPVNDVDSVFAHGQIDTNTELFGLLNEHNICLHTFGWTGKYVGSFVPTKKHKSGSTVVSQVQAYTDSDHRASIAREFVKGSIHNMCRNIDYYQNAKDIDFSREKERLEEIVDEVYSVNKISEILGKEAESRKLYYRLFDVASPDEFKFTSREYNPPVDELNALISFGNSLLYSSVISAIRTTALDPTVSYLHEPRDRRHSLSLDIADVFKPVLVDRVLFRVLNRSQVSLSNFESEGDAVFLDETGRKTVVSEFESMLEETIEHPDLDRHVSYQYLLRLEAYKLKKHILTGEEYSAFRRWW